jgi:hypothetical protein
MEVDYFNEDKFGGAMEFGGCMTNSALKFLTVKDVDNSMIRVPFNRNDEPIESLRRNYLETSRVAFTMKGRVVVFKDEKKDIIFFPEDKFVI